jgi:hypothetical protein
MAYVLTVSSTVKCAHGGSVSLSSSAKLSVGGKKVVLMSGVQGAPISGCPTPDDTNTPSTKCRTVVTANGTSTKLKVGGQPVVLDSLSGTTDGTPPPTGASFSVSDAGHTKLKAV